MAPRSPSASGRLRVIGGRWRGRRLSFPAIEGLRPTPDRVRETLFNWLAPIISGARCLDLFAGSGALGIEALSRGAGEVVFVEHHPLAARCLRDNLASLGLQEPNVKQVDALVWLQGVATAFDVVLLDPPFGKGLLGPICQALEQGHWLAPEARIYVEAERAPKTPDLPSAWRVLRENKAGQVRYALLCRDSATQRINALRE